ncbi:MAG TPA: VOC family protein [Acidimicrobiales bacterium]|nr:VOC family protein [Acidimicrobiales bacterium]
MGQEGTKMPEFSVVHHVALSVTDVERSREWYGRVLGFEELRSATVAGVALSVLHAPASALSLTLCQHRANRGERFDEKRTGLDHLSLAVADLATLRAWREHLDRVGVAHSPIAEDPFGPVLVFRDPDDIQLELVVGAA